HLVDLFDDVSLGDDGQVSLRAESLQLVARFTPGVPDQTRNLGSPVISNELRHALELDPESGVFVSRAVMDGIERSNAYLHVPGYPLLIVVGLATREFFAPWRVEVIELLGLALLLEAVVVGLSGYIYRQQ